MAKTTKNRFLPFSTETIYMAAVRVLFIAVFLAAFVPALNPARLSGLISKNASLFTCAMSLGGLEDPFIRALQQGWVNQAAITATYIGAVIAGLAVLAVAAAFCFSLGLIKMRRLCVKISAGAGALGMAGLAILYYAQGLFGQTTRVERVEPLMPAGLAVFLILFIILIVLSVTVWLLLPKPAPKDRYEIEPRFRLLLMILPFLVLVALFSYLPLWGWRVSFFDYRPGFDLTMDSFVGFKWFNYLFANPATRADIVRVLKNTLAMSGIGIATAWMPMAFAIFLSEMRSGRYKRIVQTLTTIPNFISWVLVYSVAFAIFSTEGFLNWALINLGFIESGSNYLMGKDYIWMKMWAWGTWKGLGWGAIIYLAAISGIDQQLYEAATVDGAGRFKRMWYITVPGLMSTFFVLLLLGIANVLSNGMDQYLVFHNAANKSSIQVLDLYVYQLGLASGGSGNISLATLIGLLKSIISVVLLFTANKASKWLRGESIV